jgi:hypothetical protein
MDTRYTVLPDAEAHPDHPFTHPDFSRDDVARLRYIAGRLRDIIHLFDAGAVDPRPRVMRLSEPDGRVLRVVLCNGAVLRRAEALSLVGFFGQRRPDADLAPIARMDEELLEEFLQHPGILAYCSLELEGGNWANLVLMDNSDSRLHWAASLRHTYAAGQLAPRYYATVRLHNAELPGGLLSGGDLVLLRTKYYDYQADDHWRGVRELSAPLHFAFA